MAESFIAAISKNNASRVDPDMFKLDPNSKKLDLVVNAQSKNSVSSQSSVEKIVRFKPNQLKSFSQDIQSSLNRVKQAAAVRAAEEALVRNKVKSIKSQNPFMNANVFEAQAGKKINTTA